MCWRLSFMPTLSAFRARMGALPGDVINSLLPPEWIAAQGFVLADAVLAVVLLALVALSYMMLAHMFRGWSGDALNATGAASAAANSGALPGRATATAAAGGAPGAAEAGGGSSTTTSKKEGQSASDGGGAAHAASCTDYGPVHGEIDGMTALMRASSQGDEACAVELIAAGASVDARDSQEGFTALLMASAMGTCMHSQPQHISLPPPFCPSPSPSLGFLFRAQLRDEMKRPRLSSDRGFAAGDTPHYANPFGSSPTNPPHTHPVTPARAA